jgi:hypothetical protein
LRQLCTLIISQKTNYIYILKLTEYKDDMINGERDKRYQMIILNVIIDVLLHLLLLMVIDPILKSPQDQIICFRLGLVVVGLWISWLSCFLEISCSMLLILLKWHCVRLMIVLHGMLRRFLCRMYRVLGLFWNRLTMSTYAVLAKEI